MNRLNHEQRIGVTIIILLAVLGLIAVVFGQVKQHIDRLGWQDPAAAERLVSDLITAGVIFVILAVVAAGSAVLMWLGRWLRRRNIEFEASIAHLPPAAQQAERRQRMMRDAAIAAGAAVTAHFVMEARERRQDADLARTRDRIQRIRDGLAEGR